MRTILISFLFGLFVFLSCIPNLINPGSLTVIKDSVKISGGGGGGGNSVSVGFDFPVITNLPNGDYGTSSNAIVIFSNERTISVSNFSISNAPDAYFYLVYGSNASNHQMNGLRVSEKLSNLNNASFTLLTLSSNLFCMPYTRLIVFSSNSNLIINSGIKYKIFPITANLPSGDHGTSSNTTVTFLNETNILISNFSISNAPDASFYLGYGGCPSDYRTNSLRISNNLSTLNDTHFTLTLSSNLFCMPYTHLAIFSSNSNLIINSGIKYNGTSSSSACELGRLCFPFKANLPNGAYGTSSATSVTFLNERTILVSNFTVAAPDAYFYLGYGGSAADYKARGIPISQQYNSLNNANLTLTLSSNLSCMPYTHFMVLCRQFGAIINRGIQYK